MYSVNSVIQAETLRRISAFAQCPAHTTAHIKLCNYQNRRQATNFLRFEG